MTRFEYLKRALAANCFQKKAWVLAAFSLIREDVERYRTDYYPYRLVQTPTGYYFVNPDKPDINDQLDKIEDAIPGEPLFRFMEDIELDASWCENVFEPVKTCIGNLLANKIAVVNAFGKKIPFVTGSISIGKLEGVIAEKLVSSPEKEEERTEDRIYIDEYRRFIDSLSFLAGLSQLCVITSTERTITSPPGLAEFKKQLIAKYGDRLKDPVELLKFEKELQAFDEEYIKDDPANGKFLKGKIKNVARKKMYLSIGADQSFKGNLEAVPVFNSLEEKLSTDPQQFSALINAARLGSFSRGADTVKGGVSAKILLRAGNNFKIVPKDCETTLGIPRVFTPDIEVQLIGRYVRKENAWVLVSANDVQTYLNQALIVRSPMYCKSEGDTICQFCAGQKLAANPDGVATALTEISAIILATFMSKVHAVQLQVAKYDYQSALT